MMKPLIIFVLVLSLFALISGCSGAATITPDTSPERPTPPPEFAGITNPEGKSDEAVKAGREVYRIHCVMCHGQSGKGDGPAAVSLNPKPKSLASSQAVLSDAYLFWRISEGGMKPPFLSAMPAWKNILNEDEIWEIISFLRSLEN